MKIKTIIPKIYKVISISDFGAPQLRFTENLNIWRKANTDLRVNRMQKIEAISYSFTNNNNYKNANNDHNYYSIFPLLGLSTLIAATSSLSITSSDSDESKETHFNDCIKRIKENDPTLSRVKLKVRSFNELQRVKEAIENNNQLSAIEYDKSLFPNDKQSEQLKNEIRDTLIEKVKNFEYKPTDYILALLSKHAYETPKQDEKRINFNLSEDITHSLKESWESSLDGWNIYKVYNDRNKSSYFGIVYVNHNKRQIVLAHRGTDFEWPDLLKKNSNLDTDAKSILLYDKITEHLIQTWITTNELVKEVKEKESGIKGYHITFTGHSLGGWLAEMSVFYCFSEYSHYFKKKAPTAVVFDSPGSKSMLDKLASPIQNPETKFDSDSLDIIKYLSTPNPVNICNKHIGKIYGISPDKTNVTKEFSSNQVKGSLQDNNIVKSLKSISTHSLIGIINQFDPNTGKPKKFSVVNRWPLLHKEISSFSGGIISNTIVNANKELLSSISKYTIGEIIQVILNDTTLGSIIDVFIKLVKGDIKIGSFLDLMNYLDKNYEIRDNLTAEESIRLAYDANLKYNTVKDKSIIINSSLVGTTDWRLLIFLSHGLLEVAKEKNLFDDISINLLEFALKNYKVKAGSDGDHKTHIISQDKSSISIEEAKRIFERVVESNFEIIDELINNRFHVHEKLHKKIVFAYPQLEFPEKSIERDIELHKIKDNIDKFKFTIISALSGTGKSTLAKMTATDMDARGKSFIWIEKSTIKERFDDLINVLEIPRKKKVTKDDKIQEESKNFVELRLEIYKKLEEEYSKIIFIFDQVDDKEYVELINKYFGNLQNIGHNCHAIITSCGVSHLGLFANPKDKETSQQIIHLKAFNEAESVKYLKNYIDPEYDISNIVKLLLGNDHYILPQRLKYVVGAFQDNSMTEKKYIEEYEQRKQSPNKIYPEFEIVLGKLFSNELPNANNDAWKILQICTDFLDPKFIPREIFSKIGLTAEQSNRAIDSLQGLGLIEEISNRGFKLHDLTISEVKKYVDCHKNLILMDSEKKNITKKLILALEEIFPMTTPLEKKQDRTSLLLNSIQTLTQQKLDLSDKLFNEKTAKLFQKIGEYYRIIQMHEDALYYHKKALSLTSIYDEVNENILPKILQQHLQERINIAQALEYQGTVYYDMRNWNSIKMSYKESLRNAINKCEQALKIRKLELTSANDYENVASLLCKIGNSYYYLGEREKARENIEEAIYIYKSLYPDFKKSVQEYRDLHKNENNVYEHFDHVAKAINSLGAIYYRLFENSTNKNNDFRYALKSMDCREEALEIREIISDEQKPKPSLALSLHAMGESYSILGEHKSCLDYMFKALKKREEIQNNGIDNYKDIISSHYYIGWAYRRLACSAKQVNFLELHKAYTYEKKAHDMAMEHSPRGNHFDMLNIYFGLGNIHYIAAEEIFKQIKENLFSTNINWSKISNLYVKWYLHIQEERKYFKDIKDRKLENFKENVDDVVTSELVTEKLENTIKIIDNLKNYIEDKALEVNPTHSTNEKNIVELLKYINRKPSDPMSLKKLWDLSSNNKKHSASNDFMGFEDKFYYDLLYPKPVNSGDDNLHLRKVEKQILYYLQITSLQESLGLNEHPAEEVKPIHHSISSNKDKSLTFSSSSGAITLVPETSHYLYHKNNVLKLICMISNGIIQSNTVICLERKQYGNNLGMRDVVLLAEALRTNIPNNFFLPKYIKNLPIYFDAILYNVARNKDITIVGIEGKGLAYPKESPYYHQAREKYMSQELLSIIQTGKNAVFLVGEAHIGTIIQLMNIDLHNPNINQTPLKIKVLNNPAINLDIVTILNVNKLFDQNHIFDDYNEDQFPNENDHYNLALQSALYTFTDTNSEVSLILNDKMHIKEIHLNTGSVTRAINICKDFEISLQKLLNDILNKFDIDLLFKRLYYYQEIKEFNKIISNYGIKNSVDVLSSSSEFRKIFLKIHPDKGGKQEDFVFVKGLQEKLNKEIDIKQIVDEKIQAIKSTIHKANIGIKILDTVTDTARLIQEPTISNVKKVILDGTYVYSMHYGVNSYALVITSTDTLYKFVQGEYWQAMNQVITTASYMVIPNILSYTGIPCFEVWYSAIMTCYTGYNAIVNSYSFIIEYNSVDLELKSAIAYKNLAKVLANSPLQLAYDFAEKAIKYDVRINNINLKLEKAYIKQQIEAKGEFGQKLYEYIYMPLIDEKYDLLNKITQGFLTKEEAESLKAKPISIILEDINYDHCMEMLTQEEQNKHYYCYKEEQQIIDHLVIIGNNYVEKIERL